MANFNIRNKNNKNSFSKSTSVIILNGKKIETTTGNVIKSSSNKYLK